MSNLKSCDGEDSQNARRRGSEDQERDKSVYRYLLECLTDLGIKDESSKPNESSIAKQWGQKNNRIFIRRVLRSVFPDYYEEQQSNSIPNVPGLTLGKLVEILAGIQDYRSKKRSNISKDIDNQVPPILTSTEKLRAFRKFYQLSIDEKKKLNFPLYPGETLLQELLETVTDTTKGLNYEDIIKFYINAKNNYHALKNTELNNEINVQKISSKNICQRTIKTYVTAMLKDNNQGLNVAVQQERAENLVKKVGREISRIEFQCGLRQVKTLLHKTINSEELTGGTYEFPDSFVEHLTRSIVENEILTDDFPINIKHFEIDKASPLPLYLKTEDQENGLLNQIFTDSHKEQDDEDINGLQKQAVYKVKVHFSLKFPDDYQPLFADYHHNIRFEENQKKLYFSEEITGIGSPVSHIIAVINRVLFWDIPVLMEYFPVPRDILSSHEFFTSNNCRNLLWSYNLVTLCKKKDIEKAIKEGKNYDEIIGNYEPAYGEYCGFDTVEAATKAALYTRLRAIKQTGIDPIKYLTQLCHRIEELDALRKAEGYLSFYPFSLKAMESHLNRTIFHQKYRTRNDQFDFSEIDENKDWSGVAYHAHLAITVAYLKEGLYRIGKKYIDAIKPHVEKAKKGKNTYLSDFMFAKYYICQFRYHYLTDLEDAEYRQLHNDRSSAIREARDSLDCAEKYLKKLLQKYHTIGDSAQSNFNPFFYLVSRIYLLRARLHIFTPIYTNQTSGQGHASIEPIFLLEKARINAARDGNSAHYTYWTAKQSWCYLVLAYLGNDEPLNQALSREECLDWAKRLMKHALICYKDIGYLCYQQIKDNAGKITEISRNGKYYEDYGDIKIQVVPFIQELEKNCDKSKQNYVSEKNLINLDFSILKQIRQEDNQSIYLFGTHASLLLFSMGMLELCEEEHDPAKLEGKIKNAIRMFTYSSAIAEDGSGEYGNAIQRNSDDGTLYLERDFYQGDFIVRGLYPHRLTQLTDLGKIWTATCKSILNLRYINSDWQDISKLLDTLPNVSKKQILGGACGQKRYNGHLESHCNRIVQYFKDLKSKQNNLSNLIDIRNNVVKDIFRIMRGESDVKP